MLYDPRWEQTSKVRVPSMTDFIVWLETKPPQQTYDFHNCNGMCLVGQYMATFGLRHTGENYTRFCTIVGGGPTWYDAPVVAERPYTFGAALKRARIAAA